MGGIPESGLGFLARSARVMSEFQLCEHIARANDGSGMAWLCRCQILFDDRVVQMADTRYLKGSLKVRLASNHAGMRLRLA